MRIVLLLLLLTSPAYADTQDQARFVRIDGNARFIRENKATMN